MTSSNEDKRHKYRSFLAPYILRMYDWRTANGKCIEGIEAIMVSLDKYCQDYFPGATELTQEIVTGWIAFRSAEGYGIYYDVMTYVRALSRFILSLGEPAYLPPMSFAEVKHRKAPQLLTEEQFGKLFYQLDNYYTKYNKSLESRYAVAAVPSYFRLTYSSGLRPREGISLKHQDVDYKNGTIFIRESKGHKDRTIAPNEDALLLLAQIKSLQKKANIESEYVFTNRKGRPINEDALYQILNICWSRANPEIPKGALKPLRIYDFRHMFATTRIQKWIAEGKDINRELEFLRVYMGHNSIDDTAYYYHLVGGKINSSSGADWEDTMGNINFGDENAPVYE